MKENQKIFEKQAEEALAEQKKRTKEYVLRVVPAALWLVCVIVTAACAMNTLKSGPIVTGLLTLGGAIYAFAKVLKGSLPKAK